MNKTGRDGKHLEVRVPIGTIVRDRDSGRILADLVRDEQRFVAAPGGRGGRGNASFATHQRRLPRFAERGELTHDANLRFELKLIADVGLVGFPSAGKSSLVGRLSSAKPRVEAWPFTTLTPHLGVMRAGNRADGAPIDVVLADVPGLIEGAAQGKGLGIRFLRHIERCLLLLHVLDGMPFETDRDPIRDLEALRQELREHDPELLTRPQLVVITKIDLPDGRAMAELAAQQLRDNGEEVLEVSAISGEGMDVLRYRLGELIDRERTQVGEVRTLLPNEEEVVLRIEPRGPDFSVSRDDQGRYHVKGRRIERWVQMLPLDDWEAIRYLQGRLRRAGVERALVAAGARVGDDVVISDAVFDFEPDLDDLPAEEREAVLAAEAEEDLEDERLAGFEPEAQAPADTSPETSR